MDTSELHFSKGETSKAAKRRRQRFAAEVIDRVRRHDVDRDGYCRWQRVGLGDCAGPSEWAHWGEYKRFKTRGQAPEERHTPQGTLMMCKGHHDAYDKGTGADKLTIVALTDGGCEGRLRAERNGTAYEEPIDG
jgi:hypothetical protein